MGVTRVPVSPEMLRWACERAGFDVAHLAKRIPQLPAWVRRERQPTLKQLEKLEKLEKLAKLTHTPFGYLFLPEPPAERLPVPDYRTVAGTARGTPSPDLLDTLYAMQRRQEWLREALVENDAAPLARRLRAGSRRHRRDQRAECPGVQEGDQAARCMQSVRGQAREHLRHASGAERLLRLGERRLNGAAVGAFPRSREGARF